MTALRIAIVGDGLLSALAAATLAHRAPAARILRVGTGRALDGLGVTGGGVIALPAWLRALPFADALDGTPGTGLSLGTAYAGFGAGGAWFWPFGGVEAPLGGMPLHQLITRQRASGGSPRLADYSLAALAAQAGRFAWPSDDPRSPLSTLDVGQHFATGALTDRLLRIAGVPEAAPLRKVSRTEGSVDALVLADGARLSADLYVDATGFAALLADTAAESWGHWLPVTHAVTQPLAAGASTPFAVRQLQGTGWSSTVPLDGRVAETHFDTGPVPSGATPCQSGARRHPWRGNTVAVGAAAWWVEPLIGGELLAAQRQLDRLAGLLPHGHDSAVEAAEYNRITWSEAERARDAALAFYPPTGDLPEPLARKLALYASRGVLPMEDDEPIDAADWIAILDGLGVRPRRVDPLAAAHGDEQIAAHCTRLRARLIDTLRTMPPYSQMLNTLTGHPR